jgi:hypothetical protein
VERAIALAVKAGPYVSNKDLSSFQKSNRPLPGLEAVLVPEAGEVASKQVDETGSRAVGGVNDVYDGATITLRILVRQSVVNLHAGSGFAYLVKHTASLPEAVQTLLQQRHLFFSGRSKDVAQ